MKYVKIMSIIFKAVGSILIIIASYLIGALKSREYKRRVEYLQAMQICVHQFENEMRYTKTPVKAIFEKLAEETDGVIEKIFVDAVDSFNESVGKTASSIWNSAVNTHSDELFADDKDIILLFSSCLGANDMDGQIKNIMLYKSRLDTSISNARCVYEQNSKLFNSLGLYFGILISVLLI